MSMKNVLLLGDSIRMMYEPLVKENLQDKAAVYAPPENGRWSGYTLNSLRFWIPAVPKIDIVHWNNGIWDIADNYGLGRPFTLPEEYIATLERTIAVLKKMCGDEVKIIMATTTPTVETDLSKPHVFNNAMREVAAKYSLEVNDLFSLIAGNIPEYICPDGTHLTEIGTKLAAQQVAECIGKYL